MSPWNRNLSKCRKNELRKKKKKKHSEVPESLLDLLLKVCWPSLRYQG